MNVGNEPLTAFDPALWKANVEMAYKPDVVDARARAARPPSRGPRSASALVNACLSTARRWYGSCLEDPRLGSGADRRVCPAADLWFRDEAAIDRRVRARPLATQTRELCRCCAPTLIVSPGNGRVRGSEELPRHL